jgi:hypothetical protein
VILMDGTLKGGIALSSLVTLHTLVSITSQPHPLRSTVEDHKQPFSTL